jgi:hypothetical protein
LADQITPIEATDRSARIVTAKKRVGVPIPGRSNTRMDLSKVFCSE